MTRQLLASAVVAVLAAAPGASLAQSDGRGEEVYELCAQCHGPAGEGDPLALAPAIAGLGEWYVAAQLEKFRSGLRGYHPDDVGGLRMYPMSLSLYHDGDLAAVAAYAASLPDVRPEPTLEGGDPTRGKQLYATCIACHGPEGGGNEAVKGPSLRYSSDWYLLTQLQHFKSGVRGAAPGDVQGAQMRAMSGTLTDAQAMKDVIAYIMTLGE